MNPATTVALPFCWECREPYPEDEEYRPSTCAKCSLMAEVDEAIARLDQAGVMG